MISYNTDETGTWRKNFNIHDHLGNVRAIIRLRDTSEILAQYDYAPFGEAELHNTTGKRKDFTSQVSSALHKNHQRQNTS